MSHKKVDLEWVQLMKTAKQLGLSIEDIQRFFKTSKKKKNMY
ncbi:anti-repressor SinI family protein [Alkalihalobacillus sp. 1P02AB]